MKKIFFLLFLLVILSACQNKQTQKENKKEDPITNQYNFYQDSINKAQNAQDQLINISVDVNE